MEPVHPANLSEGSGKEMLSQIGYRQAKAVQGAPWADIPLTGAANGQAAGEILDWFTEHSFFDCGSVESVYEKDGAWICQSMLRLYLWK